MELSRQDALDVMNAFHSCCVLERDLIVAISSLNFYKSSACKLLGEEYFTYADSCGRMLSELYHKVSSACLIMTTLCSDAVMDGKWLSSQTRCDDEIMEGKKDEGK